MGDGTIGAGAYRLTAGMKSGATALSEFALPRAEDFRLVDPAPASESFSRGVWTLFLLFSLELIAWMVVRLPEMMRFDNFAFSDRGANLTLQYLVANGYRPAIDFGYHYGLLPVLIARGWFALFGASPFAYQLEMLTCNILFAWALAETSVRLRVRGIGLALIVISLGYAYQSSYPNLAQAIEAILLSFALAEQARGARINALALATAAVFAKPSMGYMYGLLLVILIVRDLSRDGLTWRRLLAALAPAATVFIALATILSLVYGLSTFFRTVLPIEGLSNYRALNFGLMGAGRELWDPKGLSWVFYLIDISGFWIVSTIFLCGSAVFQFGSPDREVLAIRRREIIVTCAILHVAFLVLFFSNQWSWVYYSYVLVIGTALALDLGPYQRHFGIALCVVALLSWTDIAYWSYRWWLTTCPDVTTAGLWAPVDERAEWQKVVAMTHGKKTSVMESMGATELLSPGFEGPVSLYLVPGLMTSADLHRKNIQLASAEMVVTPILPGPCDGVAAAPEFAPAMKAFEPLWTGKHFEIFRRRTPPARGSIQKIVAGREKSDPTAVQWSYPQFASGRVTQPEYLVKNINRPRRWARAVGN